LGFSKAEGLDGGQIKNYLRDRIVDAKKINMLMGGFFKVLIMNEMN